MELNFVTQRVMALCFPPGVDAATYRDNLREVAQMLHTKHGHSYMVGGNSPNTYFPRLHAKPYGPVATGARRPKVG